MAGFQLWVNLAAKDKMIAPAYRDVPPADVPVVRLANGVSVRVIAGTLAGVAGAVSRPTTEPLVLDIMLPPGTSLDLPLPAGHNAFAYAYGGAAADVGGGSPEMVATRLDSERMAILANDAQADGVRLAAPGAQTQPSRVLLVAGKPLREPIAQHGPFVMNTVDELRQAVADFQRGALAT